MDRRLRWAGAGLALMAAAVVGILSYNAGVSHGLAISPSLASAPTAVLPYGGYRPWGWGFGFAPLLFLFFWLFVFRMLLWGGGWRRRYGYGRGGWAPGAFDEWHRRAHEQMNKQP